MGQKQSTTTLSTASSSNKMKKERASELSVSRTSEAKRSHEDARSYREEIMTLRKQLDEQNERVNQLKRENRKLKVMISWLVSLDF